MLQQRENTITALANTPQTVMNSGAVFSLTSILLTLVAMALSLWALTMAPNAIADDHKKQERKGAYGDSRSERGPIVIADIEAAVAKRFAKMDQNGDGLVAMEEFLAMKESRPPRSRDGGKRAHPESGGWDSEAEGLSKAERREMRQKMQKKGKQNTAKKNWREKVIRGARPTREERETLKGFMQEEYFALLDLNSDQSISAQEFKEADLRRTQMQAQKRAMFRTMDVNQDGYLTPSEMPNPATRLQELDRDGDGTVGRREMKAGMRAIKHAQQDRASRSKE